MKILLSVIALMAAAHLAQAHPTKFVKEYDCEIILAVGDLPQGGVSKKITRPVIVPGSHGGQASVHKFGDYTVALDIDGKWRTIAWMKGEDKVIAHVITASAQPMTTDQAIILANPENPGDILSLSCTPIF